MISTDGELSAGLPGEVGAKVRQFYEEVPFPGIPIERISSFNELEARAGIYAKALNRQVPQAASVIDVGCGTGQLLCLLGQRQTRRLVGVDFSLNSLRQGQRLASVLGLENTSFVQADIFNLPFEAEKFDYALCHGVLHHTGEPLRGLIELGRLVRKGGFASIGLYNSFGRLAHGFRRWLWRKGLVRRNASPDGFYREDGDRASGETLDSWFRDQHINPHEVTVSIVRAERWLATAGFRSLRVLPGAFSSGLKPKLSLFSLNSPDSRFIRRLFNLVTQLVWMLHPRESGYFIVIGLRKV